MTALVADRGFTLGDGLFETALWDGSRLVRFERHVARLVASADALGLPAPPSAEALAAQGLAALHAAGLGAARAAVRFAWTAGIGGRGLARPETITPGLFVSAAPAPLPDRPARLVFSGIRRNETAPSARHKTLSYIDNVMARRAAIAAGGDEAVMLNTGGALAGAAAANVIVVLDGEAFTPPVEDGALPGTVRAALLEHGLVARRLGAEALGRAQAMALSNALIGVRPAAAIDGRALDVGHPALVALAAAL